MLDGPIDLVTVSREYGSGGSEFARELGQLLGWPVLDHGLVHHVATRLRLDDRAVERLDEHPPRRLARRAPAPLTPPPAAPTSLDTRHVLPPDAVADAAHAVIVEAAQSPPLIVVGHGAQCIFGGRPGALHVRLVAPLDERVRRACGRQNADPGRDAPAVASLARRMDDDRGKYVARYYRRDWRDPLLYDAQFNTGRVSIAEAVSLVVRLVESRRAVATDGPHVAPE